MVRGRVMPLVQTGLRCSLFTLLLVPASLMAEASYVDVFLGQVDVGQTQADSHYGVQYLSPQRWTRFELIPRAGLLRTRHASHYLFAGVSRHSALTRRDNGFALALGFAPGFYHHGGGDDTDLGYPLQFKSSVGLHYDLPDGTRLGLHFSHMSNASLADTNPGTELLTLRYGLRF